MSLSFGLSAHNSGGKQSLVFNYNEEENMIYSTLFGKIDNKGLQIDFDGLCEEDMRDLVSMLQIQLGKFK